MNDKYFKSIEYLKQELVSFLKYILYFSGDYAGTMMNDGLSLFGEGKKNKLCTGIQYTDYSAETLSDANKFEEFFTKLKSDIESLINNNIKNEK